MGISAFLTLVLVLIGAFMVFLIMLQEGKGGGMAALGGTKAAAIEGVTNPIRRATAYLAGLFFVLAVVLGIMNRPTTSENFIPAVVPTAATTTTMTETPKVEVKTDSVKVETATDAPKVEVKADAPKVEVKADAPKVEVKTEAPKVEVKPEAPKAEPKADAPKAPTEAPKAPAPVK